MSKQKVIAVIVFFLILIGLGAGIYLMRQQQDLREKAAPATTISLKKPTKTILVGESFDVTVEVNTSTNQLSSAKLEINFDKEKLKLVSFLPSTSLPVKLENENINNNNGTATITLGAQVSNPFQGKDIIATLKFEAKSAGNASITFGPNTVAAGLQEGARDVILSRDPTTITILATATGASPSPSGQTTAAASPSPSAPVGGTAPNPSASPIASAAPSTVTKPTVNLPANKTVKPGDTITGTAVANSTVTITIKSDPITATVKADSTGKWSYTLPKTLSAGTHTLTVTDSNGSYITTFTVSGTTGTSATLSGQTPVAGTSWPTLVGLASGLLLIFIGSLFALK